MSPINPGAGMMGRQLPMGTDSRAPAGPQNRTPGRAGVSTPPRSSRSGRLPSDNRQPALRHNPAGRPSRDSEFEQGSPGYAWDAQQSKYRNARPTAPPNDIRDVDIDRNWFTPFQPVWPFGPPFVNYPREWDYQVGINLEYLSKRVSLCEHLRLMSRSNGIVRSVIETRKDQFMRMPWAFQLRDKPDKRDKRVEELKDFFRRPDGKHPYGHWVRRLLDDLLVIDAPTVYRGWRRRDGKPYVLEVLDGKLIKPLVDDAGRIPDYPDPAYQQLVRGLPMINLDETEIIYSPMRPTAELPVYGFSPLEQVMLEATQAIRRQLYQLNFWNESSIPDVWATAPESWTPQQIAQFQAMHDALYGGNLRLKSKVRFMPGGVKPTPVKGSAGELLKSEYDEWLARLICYAYSVSPQPFVREVNRATAQTAKEQAETEGLRPLMQWWKEAVMDRLILEDFGYEDIEFAWLPDEDVDPAVQAKTLSVYVRSAIMTVNEARDQIGLPEVAEGDTLILETSSGGVPLAQALSGEGDDATPPRSGSAPHKAPQKTLSVKKKTPILSAAWKSY